MLIYQTMSIVAALLTLAGYIFNIYKRRVCFWIWILGNFVWLASCAIILNVGLILNNIIFLFVNFLGWVKWRKDDKSKPKMKLEAELMNDSEVNVCFRSEKEEAEETGQEVIE